MVFFDSDYIAGAHPKVLQRLTETNLEATPGYGLDPYCEDAKTRIRQAAACPDAEIYFLVGGTQTNAVVIASLLASYEGVVSADTGHVSIHEAGAIEYTGHKVLPIPHRNGKLDPQDLRSYLERFYADGNHEHMVFPGMVYISHPTEYGTLYSLEELWALSGICREYEIPLYLDGARLGYGLASRSADVTLPDIAELTDAFYIGGTKVGALFGEAVVFPKGKAPRHFMTLVKQHGALLAKGRLLGLQFGALFTDDLYMEIGRHAIDMAEQMKALLLEKGYTLYMDSPTNQQFVVLEDEQLKALSTQVGMSFWEKVDEHHTAVRLATSWSTTQEDMDKLRELL